MKIMIYLKKKNLGRYFGLGPAMDTAIRYIQTADLTQLVKGRHRKILLNKQTGTSLDSPCLLTLYKEE